MNAEAQQEVRCKNCGAAGAEPIIGLCLKCFLMAPRVITDEMRMAFLKELCGKGYLLHFSTVFPVFMEPGSGACLDGGSASHSI
jgi:hypothetical protein